ncbi:ABC transporter substrate-binding protein [Planotetraspora phitsanulokensis]|uniref:ABC transporter substrate-binding protein n=1 Tax=Planotetraspora phitsanulokensis TaxID=575192 RepID=A0A8J3XFD2_9ACTN|nr:ABC transporter substrate-binding protein [Planotetraspora phitsanulokensis]GII39532.1 ABC transporter substrate-binding protein [Planotetraspora phitsanulokensis]
MGKLRPGRITPMLTAALLAVSVAACGGGSGEPAASGQPAEKIKLTVGLFSDFHFAPLYEEFKKTHPNVEIVERRAQFNDHHKNLTTQLATGAGAADVVAVEAGYIATFTPLADKFYDLGQYGLGKRQADYLDWKWSQGLSPDGKLLGLGTDIGGLAMCYRTDLFKEAGLPTNRDEVSKLWPTWEDYSRVGQQFVAAKVKGAKWFDGPGENFRAMVDQAPVGYYDEQNNLVAGTNPDVKKAWDLSVQMLQADESAKLLAFSPPWNTGLTKGSFATIICPSWKTGSIKDAAPTTAGKWDVAAVPGGGGGNQGGTHLMAPKQGKHPKEAAELIDLLTSKDNQLKLFTDAGALPSIPALYDDPTITGFTNPFFSDAPTGKIFTDAAKALKPQHVGPKAGDVLTAFGNALQRVEQGKQQPDAAWQQALQDLDRIK